ncbi:MAG: sulfur carrier protein ThiS [Acidobacteriia bacterium]|nr:sulfur carrier protein ThiS [Methyloceanibacter sp.]MCL6491226.1 sulfur carrier protein ThiS [Terriglobia bacterium]
MAHAATSSTIMLNGEPWPLEAPLTVAELLVKLGLDTRKIAVECNEELVPRSRYGETWLKEGDAVEIVHFIGGG